MKKIIYILFCLVAVETYSQQVTFFNQSNLVPELYNPSIVGTDQNMKVSLLRRAQWVGFDNSPINHNLIFGYNLKDHHGLGININHQKQGITQALVAKAMYGYHIKLNEDSHLDAGLSAGYVSQSMNFNEVSVVQDVNDPMLNGGITSGGADLSLGLGYRRKELKIGVAVPQILSQSNDQLNYKTERTYIANALYKFDLAYRVELEPFAVVRYVPNAPLQYDIKARAIFWEYWWVGAGYRSNYAVNLDLGVYLKSFYVGYSYDIPLQNYSNYGQSHEILIVYRRK